MPKILLKTKVLIFVLTVWAVQAAAQQTPSQVSAVVVSGVVRDSASSEPLSGTTIRLVRTVDGKDLVVESIASGEDGKFAFNTRLRGTLTMQVQHLGYEMHTREIVISNQPIKSLEIKMRTLSIALDGVVVQAQPDVVLKGDTTEFNASSFPTEAYADSDALLAQLPGVEIDAQGNVQVQGEQVTRVIVDGKEFFSSDPRIALKSLPADIIDKIQFIDEKSRQAQFTGFDDGERNKIINIVTKPEKRSGYFGRMSAAAGNSERYNTGGSVNFFSGVERISINAVTNNVSQSDFSMPDVGADGGDSRQGGRGGRGGSGGIPGQANTHSLSLNYNNEWLEKITFNTNYTINSTNSRTINLVNRETLIDNQSNQISVSRSENDRKNQSHRVNFDLRYEIDSMQSLDFEPNFRIQRNTGTNSSSAETNLKDADPLNASERMNANERTNLSFGGQLNYRLRLAKAGRTVSFRVDGNSNSNKGLAQNYTINQYFEDHILGRIDTTNSQNNTLSSGNGYSGRVSYTEPLGQNFRVEGNYSLRNRANYSNRETLDYLAETGQFSELNRQLSNEFNNDNLYQSAGLTFMFNKEHWNISTGMNFQTSTIQNQKIFPENAYLDHGFQSYLPHFRMTFRPSRSHNFRFEYRASTNAPSVNQLQDVVNNENPLNIRTGNPQLVQEYAHRLNFTFNKTNRQSGTNINITLNSDIISNRVVNSLLIARSDTTILPGVVLGKGGQYSRPINMNGYYTSRANVSLGFPIKALKINLNSNSSVDHTHDVGMLNDLETSSNSYSIRQRVGVNSKISQKIIFGISYAGSYSFVNSPGNASENFTYLNQTFRNDLTWIFWKGLRFNSSLNYNRNAGISQNYAQEFMVWNLSFGKKLLRNQRAELTFTAYDVLNKGVSVNRSVTERYITDTQTNLLKQYFMLSFTYNLRHFGSGFGGFGG